MKNELKKNECALGLDVTSRLIGTGHFQPPVLGPKWCVVQWERKRVPITLTPTCTQPPGSRHQTLRVSTHGQRAAPFSEESYLSAWACSRHILCPNRQGVRKRNSADIYDTQQHKWY